MVVAGVVGIMGVVVVVLEIAIVVSVLLIVEGVVVVRNASACNYLQGMTVLCKHNHVCAVPPLSALAYPRAGAGGPTGPCRPAGPPARGLLYLRGAALLVEVMECRQEISESRLNLTT